MNEKSFHNSYAFVLVREREIALAELQAVLGRFCFGFSIISVSGNVAILKIDKPREKVAKLIDVLGGTVKIYEIVHSKMNDQHSNNERQINSLVGGNNFEISKWILNLVQDDIPKGKFNFGLSSFTEGINKERINKIGLEIKKELKHQGISSRFVALREGKELSTIQTLKNSLVGKGIEIGLFGFPHYYSSERSESRIRENFSTPVSADEPRSDGSSKEIFLGVLIGLSNPEEWSERDYGKPAGDKYSGMLPPKLARAMVNIALAKQTPNHLATNH